MDCLSHADDVSETSRKRDQMASSKAFCDEPTEEGHTEHTVDDNVVESRLPRKLRVQVQRIQIPGSRGITS
jgi:hypothetical protein